MVIIRQSPASAFRLPSVFDGDFWPKFPSTEIRGLNIYKTEDAVIAEAAVPEIPEDKIDLSVEDSTVRITAASEEKVEEKVKKGCAKKDSS